MNPLLKPQWAWFPWLVYLFVFLQSVVSATVLNPASGYSDEQLLYATVLAVLWVERKGVVDALAGKDLGYVLPGFLVFFLGLFLLIIGKLGPVLVLDVWGLFLIASGFVAMMAGKEFGRSATFIGLSGTVLVILGRAAPDALSSELAVAIAGIAAGVLDALFIPVVANGVMLFFGPYSAEVTVECSGMNSIFSLLALSLLYLGGAHERPLWHTGVLVLMVIPFAVLTNLFRVMLLVLSTMFVGDGFAQGIFHDTAGILLFIMALGLLAGLDALLLMVGSSLSPNKSAE